MGIQGIGDVSLIADIMSAIAVVATLGYLALQIRQSNKHAMLQSIQHTWSSMSDYCSLISQSEEVCSIVVRGRESFNNLDKIEQERFVHAHIQLLNCIECWHMMITESYPKGALRDHHLKNIKGIITGYFDHPGTVEFLEGHDSSFVMPGLYQLFLKNTSMKNTGQT